MSDETIAVQKAAGRDGQFGELPQPDNAEVELGGYAPRVTGARSERDDNSAVEEHTLTGDERFLARCRLLLGVPANAKVTVTDWSSEVNLYGCDTWESSAGVSVESKGCTKHFDDLPGLFRALDATTYEQMTEPAAETLWKTQETIEVFTAQWSASGTIGNLHNGRVLLCNTIRGVQPIANRVIAIADIIGFKRNAPSQ